jgi:hypothetical protein
MRLRHFAAWSDALATVERCEGSQAAVSGNCRSRATVPGRDCQVTVDPDSRQSIQHKLSGWLLRRRVRDPNAQQVPLS